MNKVFWQNIIPQLDDWKENKTNGKDTEKALLRYIISHITEMVDVEEAKYFTAEMYISPVISDAIKTGCIVKEKRKGKEEGKYYIVLSPACDLAIHNGEFKT